jgi:hypothetical protein
MEEWASLFYMSNHANLKYSLLFSPPIVPIFQCSPLLPRTSLRSTTRRGRWPYPPGRSPLRDGVGPEANLQLPSFLLTASCELPACPEPVEGLSSDL